jgi:hypothetical protein
VTGHTKEHNVSETDPVSKMLCSLEYWTMDKVQKPSNPKCYTPSTEPFRINPIIKFFYMKLKNRPQIRKRNNRHVKQ